MDRRSFLSALGAGIVSAQVKQSPVDEVADDILFALQQLAEHCLIHRPRIVDPDLAANVERIVHAPEFAQHKKAILAMAKRDGDPMAQFFQAAVWMYDESGQRELLKTANLLKQAGFNTNSRGTVHTPLFYACRQPGAPLLAEWLIDNGASMVDKERNVLQDAARFATHETLNLLLDKGAGIYANTKDEEGLSPIDYVMRQVGEMEKNPAAYTTDAVEQWRAIAERMQKAVAPKGPWQASVQKASAGAATVLG